MKENKEIANIRKLLDRWYDGTATSEEEAALVAFFETSESIPENMDADRLLFMSFAEARCNEREDLLPELPVEYQDRISEALEKEMSAEATKPRRKSSFMALMSDRRKWWGVAACGVFLLCVIASIRFLSHDTLTGESQFSMQTAPRHEIVEIPDFKVSEDTFPIRTLVLTEPSNGHPKAMATSSTSKGARGIKECSVRMAGDIEDDESEIEYGENDNRSYYACLSEAEEEKLMRNNYRVINDAAEADELLSSIFGRMESNVEMESCRLSRIELEYASEMVKLTNLTDMENMEKN